MHPNRSDQLIIKKFLVLISILVFILSSCQPACEKSELDDYLFQIETIQIEYQELTNLSANHPETKTENVKKMNDLLVDFSSLEPPKCALGLSKKVLKAMNSSITYLAPSEDIFYYPYQLAKFAMDDWEAVEEETSSLQIENQEYQEE